MKTLNKHIFLFPKKVVMVVVFITLVFSCSKNTDTPTDVATHFCNNIIWKNTIGLSGNFFGEMVNNHYDLVAVNILEKGINTNHPFNRTNNTNVILNDQPGWTFTYNAGNIVKLVIGEATGTETFTFDTDGHLTNTDIESSDNSGSLSLKYSYTYDVNDDPVKIVGHGISTSSSGTTSADYNITADYLTDKVNFIPLVPEITPFSIFYAYSYYLSKHLINKWVIKIDGTTDQGVAIPTINFTQQYTYTYDANGNVVTMVHTGNSNDTYTFTYSGCN
jgi:YD repeat-containing protein